MTRKLNYVLDLLAEAVAAGPEGDHGLTIEIVRSAREHLLEVRKEVEEIEHSRQWLARNLARSAIRLNICLGRMRACAEEHPGAHEVSIRELPDWIDETKMIAGVTS